MNIFWKFANTFLLFQRTIAKKKIPKLIFVKKFGPKMGKFVFHLVKGITTFF